jgi:hypothetical protein
VLSLIVPSHRDESLRRKLESLTTQSLPASSFEVILVMLEREQKQLVSLEQDWPFQIRSVVIPDDVARGKHMVALKRNWGARAATSDLYMLTDDDVFHPLESLKTFTDFFAGGFRGIASCDLRFESEVVFRLGAKNTPLSNLKWVQFSTSFIVIDRATYEKVGSFKDDFKGRGADIDYGYRAHKLGIPMKRLAGDYAVHEGSPRNDFAVGKTSGYGAYLASREHGPDYALALGVHPVSLGLKSLAFKLGLSRLFTTTYYKEYERGYLQGALEAREEQGNS